MLIFFFQKFTYGGKINSFPYSEVAGTAQYPQILIDTQKLYQ